MNFTDYKLKSQGVKLEKIKNSGFLYRLQRGISLLISWFLIKLFPNVSANTVSVINIILVLLIFLLSFVKEINYLLLAILQLFLLFFSSILDKIDGEVARFREYFTQKGIYYDLIYHFFYPFVLYFSVGFYFYKYNQSLYFILFVFLSSLVAVCYKMLGKLKHHILYKIKLENHELLINDFVVIRTQKRKKTAIERAIFYFFTTMYDWVWTYYFILIILSHFDYFLSFWLFTIHLFISLIYFLVIILYLYPQRKLYDKNAFNIDGNQ